MLNWTKIMNKKTKKMSLDVALAFLLLQWNKEVYLGPCQTSVVAFLRKQPTAKRKKST